MTVPPQYQYDAFISYNRRDLAFAVELERRLERYRPFPMGGRRRHPLNIFRDAEDLVGADYHHSIASVLADSAKLIVLCSPNSAASIYVDDEIKKFLARRSTEDLILVLIDGIPNNEAGADNQHLRAFCPGLCAAVSMPLAIDYRGIDLLRPKLHQGKYQGAWYTLLASILGTDRYELERRQQRLEAQRRNLILGAAAVVIVLLSIATLYAIQQKRVADHERTVAEQAKQTAEFEKDKALRGESRSLSLLSKVNTDANQYVRAANLAIEALPRSQSNPERPYLPEAEERLYAALPALAPHLVLRGHTDRVTFGAFSPDGTKVVSVSHDGSARIWDAATGSCLRTLSGKGRVAHAAFSPDGHRLATADEDGCAKLWDADTGRELGQLGAGAKSWDLAYYVSFSSDGQRLAVAAYRGHFSLWDVRRRNLISHPEITTTTAHSLFSPDGRLIVTTDRYGGTVSLWDGTTGMSVGRLAGHEAGHYSAAFSPDSRRLVTAAADQMARIWNLATRSTEHVLRGHSDKVFHAEFSPDGQRVVTVSKDGTGRLWSVDSGETIARLLGHKGEVRHAAFSPDGKRVVTSSRDDTAMVWDGTNGTRIATLAGHTADVTHAVFSADGQRILSAGDQTIRIWNLADLDMLALTAAQEPTGAISFSPTGELVATGSGIMASAGETSRDPTVRLWGAKTGELRAELKGHTMGIRSLDFSADGQRLVSLSWDWSVGFWDVTTYRLLKMIPKEEPVLAIALSPQAGLVATGNKEIVLWSIHNGESRGVLVQQLRTVQHLAFSQDGRLLASASSNDLWASASSDDKKCHLWDVARRVEAATLTAHDNPVAWISFAPNGRRLATADGRVRVWDPRDGSLIYTLDSLGIRMNHVAFSPDSRLLVGTHGDYGDGTVPKDTRVILWDAMTGQPRPPLEGHTKSVIMAEFDAKGERLVTASTDGTARVWRLNTGKTIAVFAHGSQVNMARFDAAGRWLGTAVGDQFDDVLQRDNAARLWRLQPDTDSLIQHAQQRLGTAQLGHDER